MLTLAINLACKVEVRMSLEKIKIQEIKTNNYVNILYSEFLFLLKLLFFFLLLCLTVGATEILIISFSLEVKSSIIKSFDLKIKFIKI
jgi:hypothetical protein